jgi:hypothetical protein
MPAGVGPAWASHQQERRARSRRRGRRRSAQPEPDVRAQIVGESYKVLKRLDADEELLAIIGSWRDTLDDGEVLVLLRDYNAGRPTLHRPQ